MLEVGESLGICKLIGLKEHEWSPLQSMPPDHFGVTSNVYNNNVRICYDSGLVDHMTRMSVGPQTDILNALDWLSTMMCYITIS
jgi:hypothetical protein